ncbi:DUF7210 family protein [Oceanobacter mangrovi]|uniref:DUF7210 family protein n=1 Tax=Oceanobacter mangrovi TaxID=2862510 RepID=UPI001C8DB5F8|nr:hypothetical protein [Oceanobacter mangrovi]
MATKSTTSATTTVTLAAAHKHQGKDYPAGAKLTVSLETAAWLQANGVVKPDEDAAADSAKTTTQESK